MFLDGLVGMFRGPVVSRSDQDGRVGETRKELAELKARIVLELEKSAEMEAKCADDYSNPSYGRGVAEGYAAAARLVRALLPKEKTE